MLKISTASVSEAIFRGDNFVIQTWRHTTETMNGSAALKRKALFSQSLSAGLCANIDNPNYQPKLGGLDRPEKEI